MIPFNKHNVNKAIQSMNEDLTNISDWSSRNSLVLNPTKSKYLVLGSKKQIELVSEDVGEVKIAGVPIERVFVARNLGVMMDCHLRFEEHVLNTVHNCFYKLKLLYNIRQFISVDLRVKLCESLILSKFNYCDTVFGPCLLKKTQKFIQRVQNACARFCFHIPPRTSVTPYLTKARMLKMTMRQHLHLASLLFGVLKTGKPSYLLSKLVWRQQKRIQRSGAMYKPLIIPKYKCAAFRGSFRFQATKCWNDLPPPIRNCNSRPSFHRKLREFLLENQAAGTETGGR